MVTLPLDEAYGCKVRDGKAELYFGRGANRSAKRDAWLREVDKFVSSLE